MKKLSTIIVDDEQNNIDVLEHFIHKYCPELEIIATCTTYDKALEVLTSQESDLVFLDIMLDRNTSFDLLGELNEVDFQIIFTTAYDEYAIKAFDFNAVAYLLKPIVIDDLTVAVERSKERMQNKVFIDKDQINYLSQSITEVKTSNFVIVSGMDKVDFLNPDEIICLKSSGRYTQFILKDAARQVVSSKSIGEYEDTLSKTAFFRIHNSYLINLSHIISIDKKGGTYCTLSNGSVLPISRRRYDGLMRLFRDK